MVEGGIGVAGVDHNYYDLTLFLNMYCEDAWHGGINNFSAGFLFKIIDDNWDSAGPGILTTSLLTSEGPETNAAEYWMSINTKRL